MKMLASVGVELHEGAAYAPYPFATDATALVLAARPLLEAVGLPEDALAATACAGVGALAFFCLAVAMRPTPSVQEVGAAKRSEASLPTSCLHIWAITLMNVSYGFMIACQGILLTPLEAERLWPGHASSALAVLAVLVGVSQLIGPIAGRWSDNYRHVLGRRRPLLATSAAFVFALTFALCAASQRRLPCAFIGIFFAQQAGLNVLQSAQAGLVPDLVPAWRRGFAGGVSAANFLLGALVAFVCMQAMQFWDYHVMYAISACLLGISAMIVCLVSNENSSLDRAPRRESSAWLRPLLGAYSFDFRAHRGFALLLVTKAIYYATVAVKGFLLFFLRDTFHISNPADSEALVSELSMAAELSAAIAAVCAMVVLDEKHVTGAQPSERSRMALRWGAVWMACFWWGPALLGAEVFKSNDPAVGRAAAAIWHMPMVGGTAIWGLGQGVYLAGDQALQFVLLPDAEEGARLLSLMSVCAFAGTAMGGAVAGVLLATLGAGARSGYSYPGYAGVFAFASSCCLSIAVIISFVRPPRAKEVAAVLAAQ